MNASATFYDRSLTGLRNFAELVKFSHTIFLFPFALAAVVLAAAAETITVGEVFWMVVALVSARSAAMVMNRIADRRYDALNPRTASRPLTAGRVTLAQAWLWLALACAGLILASAMLNPLALMLSPLALIWVLGYSFTKRFTMLCHLWLGAATALAPVGAWIAVTGSWDWRMLVMAVAVACWVAGFDVIYATMDIAFDRAHDLHSLPARLGKERALWLARGLHLVAVLGFAWLARLFGLGGVYLIGVAIIALVLVAQHLWAALREADVPLAFFTLSGAVSILYLAALSLDRALGA